MLLSLKKNTLEGAKYTTCDFKNDNTVPSDTRHIISNGFKPKGPPKKCMTQFIIKRLHFYSLN